MSRSVRSYGRVEKRRTGCGLFFLNSEVWDIVPWLRTSGSRLSQKPKPTWATQFLVRDCESARDL